MSKKYSDTENSTPVLSALLLEGIFADCIGQIKMSLDCCREDTRKLTGLSLTKNIVVTHSVALEQVSVVVDITKNHSSGALNKKHRYFVARLRTFDHDIRSFEIDRQDTHSLQLFLRLLTEWLADSHLIMMEETPRDVREYLASKGGYDKKAEEYALDIVRSGSPGSAEDGPSGLDAFSAEIIEGGARKDQSGPSSGHPRRVRGGKLHILSVGEARDNDADSSPLEDEGELESGFGVDDGLHSGEGSGSDTGEAGASGDGSGSSDRRSDCEPEGNEP